MQKQLAGTAVCGEIPVRYFLLEERLEDQAAVYGVSVECGGEEDSVRQLARSRERVEALLDSLARGVVTPVTLRDVVEDWLLQ